MKAKILATAALLISSFSFNADAAHTEQLQLKAHDAAYSTHCAIFEEDLNKSDAHLENVKKFEKFESSLNAEDKSFYNEIKLNTKTLIINRFANSSKLNNTICNSLI